MGPKRGHLPPLPPPLLTNTYTCVPGYASANYPALHSPLLTNDWRRARGAHTGQTLPRCSTDADGDIICLDTDSSDDGVTVQCTRTPTEAVMHNAQARLRAMTLQKACIADFVRWALSRAVRGTPSGVTAALTAHFQGATSAVPRLVGWHVIHGLLSARGPYLVALKGGITDLIRQYMPNSDHQKVSIGPELPRVSRAACRWG